MSYFINFNRLALSLIPISLIFSIFVADLLVVISSISLITFAILKKNIAIFNTKEFKIFLIFYAVCLISSIFSDYSNEILFKSIAYIRFGLLIVLIQYLIKNDHKFIKYFLFSILFSFFILILGLILQIIGFEYFFLDSVSSRYSSFFFDELILGSYIIKLLPLSIALLLFTNSNKYLYVLPLLAVISIFLSGERTAFISLLMFVSLLITFTNIVNFRQKLFSLALVLTCLFTVLALFPQVKFRLIDQTLYQLNIIETGEDYKEFLVAGKTTVAIVKEEHFITLKYYLMFKTAYKIFKDNFVLGSGIKTFKKLCKNEKYYIKKNYKAFEGKPDDYYKGYTGVDGCSTHPHNYYLQLLAETGIFSFLIITYCFFYYLLNFFKKNNLPKKIIYLSIVVNLFPFLFSGSFFNNFISIMILLPIAFSCLNKNNDKINKDY